MLRHALPGEPTARNRRPSRPRLHADSRGHFTVFSFACVKCRADNAVIPDFFPWKRQDAVWLPGCSHYPMGKGVRGDMSLSEEGLGLPAISTENGKVATDRQCLKRQRQEDAAWLLEKGHLQIKKCVEKNPG